MTPIGLIIVVTIGIFLLFFIDSHNNYGGGGHRPTKIYRGNPDSPDAPDRLHLEDCGFLNEKPKEIEKFLTKSELLKIKADNEIEICMRKAENEAKKIDDQRRISVAENKLHEVSQIKGVQLHELLNILCNEHGRFHDDETCENKYEIMISDSISEFTIITVANNKRVYSSMVDNELLEELIKLDVGGNKNG